MADPRTRPLLVIKTQANVLNLVLIRVTNQGVLWPTKLWFLLLYISTSPHGAPDRHIQLLVLMFLVFPWNLERDDCTLHGYEIIIFFQKHWKFVKVILSDQGLCFCAERKAVDVIVFHVNFVSASKYASPLFLVLYLRVTTCKSGRGRSDEYKVAKASLQFVETMSWWCNC